MVFFFLFGLEFFRERVHMNLLIVLVILYLNRWLTFSLVIISDIAFPIKMTTSALGRSE